MRWILAIVVSACAASSPPPLAAPSQASAPPARAEPPRPAADAAVDLPAAANGLWWDAASATLYITDSGSSRLLTWSEARGIDIAATLPASAAGVSLGGIIERGDGTLLVASFGFGTEGGIFAVSAGAATALTGLDPARRRVGLAQDPDGAVYCAYFVGGRGKQAGGIAQVTIAGGAASETVIASGFHKAVGVAATHAAVFVSDQTDHAIYRIALPGYAVSKLADVPAVDLLAVLPGGDLVTGGGPAIWRIAADGRVTAVRTGFEQIRGLAYDAAGQRLFAIDHSVTIGIPDKLRILHLDAP